MVERDEIIELSGARKCALLLLSLDAAAAGALLRRLDEKEAKRIVAELAAVRDCPAEMRRAVAEEFENLSRHPVENPFEFLRHVTAEALVEVLKEEHPRVVALVVSRVPYHLAAEVMGGLPGELAERVAERLSVEKSGVAASAQAAVVAGLASKLAVVAARPVEGVEGFEEAERAIKLADERGVRAALRGEPLEELLLGLRAVGEAVKRKIVRNLPAGVREAMGGGEPVRVSDIERGQRRLIRVAQRLGGGEVSVIGVEACR